MRRSGVRLASLLLPLALATACLKYGFAGGGLPQHVKTVAVLPFENETPITGLQRELYEGMRRDLERRLGLRAAGEDRADAVVRGRILRYDVDIPVGYSANRNQSTSARRRLQITLDVEIVDQTNGKTLWARKSLSAEGEYNEGAELAGRRAAIEKIVNDVIAGAQSQW